MIAKAYEALIIWIKSFFRESSDNSEVEQLKIKLSILKQERDSCIRQLNTINVNLTQQEL